MVSISKILSVIIPSYNVEKYIKKTLDSLTTTCSIDELEILVINDGSTDGTKDIVNNYVLKYPQSVKLINKVNGGHGSAINIGIENASGKYLCVVDGDDWVNSSALEEMVSYMRNADADVILTNFKKVDVVTGEIRTFIIKGMEYKRNYTMDELKPFQMEIGLINICYLRQLLIKIKLHLQEHVFYEDNEYCIIPFQRVEKVAFLNLFFYYYRVGNSEQSMDVKNRVQRIADLTKVTKSVILFYQSTEMAEASRQYCRQKIRAMIYSIYLTMLIFNENKSDGRKYVRNFRRYLCATSSELKKETDLRYKIFVLMSFLGANYKIWEKYEIIKNINFSTRQRL
jgi:glycosyltransferase involved in cell wall biosynthesis